MPLTKEDLLARVPNPSTTYDVIVCGAGPAGIGAALAAAMNGAKTLILEARSQFGGTATAALWMKINWLFADDQETTRGGAHQLLIDKIRSYGPKASIPGHRETPRGVGGGNIDANPVYLRRALFELFADLGIDSGVYSPVTGVLKEDNRVVGVTITGKEGLINYRGKVVIDATGDGDVCARAGCQMTEGREEDGKHMPMTLVFAIGNVDVEKLWTYVHGGRSEEGHGEGKRNPEAQKKLDEARKSGKYTMAPWYNFDKTTVPGILSVNNGGCGTMNLDGAKTNDLTAMERLGVAIATDFVEFLKDYSFPGAENAALVCTGAAVAIRDTRRLVGQYTLSEQDVLSETKFPDVVATKYGGIDAVGFKGGVLIPPGSHYPYRSMLPKTIDGLLAAGRCGSASFLGHSSGKSMGNMMSLGQGAGVAAAIAAKSGVTPRNVDVAAVQAALKAMGVKL